MPEAIEPLVYSLRRIAGEDPQRRAFREGAGEISWGEFWRLTQGAAARLRAAAVAPGDRVLIYGPNGVPVAAAYFAVHALGAIAVPLAPDTPEATVLELAEFAAVRAAFLAAPLAVPAACIELSAVRTPPDPLPPWEPACRAEDPADLLFTTGTAGKRKGVLLSQANIAQAARNINAFIPPEPGDVEVVPLPLSHSFGLGRLRCWAQAGHCLVLEPGMRNAAALLKRILDLRATGLALVPAGFDLLLRMTKDRLGDARDHLRYVEIGSAPMERLTKIRLMELLPRTRLCHHFGLTEASRAAFIEYHADREKLDSIGRPSPNVEIAIHDEQGTVLPPEMPGEIVVRGGMVMREYWRQPELTRQAFRGQWLRTDDWGYRDRDGYLFLLGRQKDLINVGGLKTSPEEVEQWLNRFPGVRESACVGVPDPDGITGQCVKVFLVSQKDVSLREVASWLRGRLEEYKIPRLLERVDTIPKTSSGKIQRYLLR